MGNEESVEEPVIAEPMVSVVVPTKNQADFLREALESILGQDYRNIECIVVDGGSSDGTVELLKRYGDRIDWLSEADRGAFDAINKGWRRSKGEILAWLNADDCWEEGAVRQAVGCFSREPDVDVVYGACGTIDEQGRFLEEYPARPWDLGYAVEHCDHIINQAASFLRRSMVERVGFLYPAWCHDHDLWLRIALAGGRFEAIPQRLANARMRQGNLGHDSRIVVPGKIGLTRRFFAVSELPPEFRRIEAKAMSNAYLRCITYLSPSWWRNRSTIAMLAFRAILAKPTNTPAIVALPLKGLARKAAARPRALAARIRGFIAYHLTALHSPPS